MLRSPSSSSTRLPALQLLMQQLGAWIYLLSQANIPLMTALLSQNLDTKPTGGRPWASGSDLQRALLVRSASRRWALMPRPANRQSRCCRGSLGLQGSWVEPAPRAASHSHWRGGQQERLSGVARSLTLRSLVFLLRLTVITCPVHEMIDLMHWDVQDTPLRSM